MNAVHFMKENPDYSRYGLTALHDALEHLDRVKHPERYQELTEALRMRTEEGYSLSAEEGSQSWLASHIPLRGVALKVWWATTWRSILGLLVFALPFAGIIGATMNIAGENKAVSGAVAGLFGAAFIILLPFVLAFFVRQALAKNYKHFRLELYWLDDDRRKAMNG